MGVIKTMSLPALLAEPESSPKVDSHCNPFITQGFVSLTGEEKDEVFVTILLDTGAYQSFLVDNVLPLSVATSCESIMLVRGIKMSVLKAPLHKVYLHSILVAGLVKVAVRPQLPISGVTFIFSYDFAG